MSLADWCTLHAVKVVHECALLWHVHVWVTTQIALVDVVNQLINAFNVVNEGDRDWTFPAQDFITYCISSVEHVLHLFNVERDAHLPTLKGSGSIIFGVLIYYGDPACAGFTGDAISGIAKDDPAVVVGGSDLPLIHNSVHELWYGVVH